MRLRRQTSILGLSLEPDQVAVCRLQRQGEQCQLSNHLLMPIPADKFKSDPAQAGHDLRSHMQAAHIRPERCVVCLPLSWAFAAEVDLPALSATDLQGFIRLEAERRFPLAPEDLALTVSSQDPAQGAQRAMLVGIPLEYLSNITTALKAARMHPASITFGVTGLANGQSSSHSVLIYGGRSSVDLAVMGDGSPSALRNLMWQEGAPETDVRTNAQEIARQLRISLAQIPQEERSLVKSAALYGPDEWPAETYRFLEGSLSGQGISLDRGTVTDLSPTESVSPALFACARRALQGSPPTIELLPKHKPRMSSLAARLSARGARWAIGIVGAALLLVGIAFGLQGRQLSRLEKQWGESGPEIEAAKALQDRVRKYRSWYDEGVPSLAIPKSLALAFPEEGAVWVKSLRVKDRALATCSGSATSRRDWMQVMEKLGQNRDLDDLQIVQAHGDTPFTFRLTFRWKGRDAGGN